MKKNPCYSLLYLLALVLVFLLSQRLNPLDYTGGRSRDDEERLRRNASSIALMIGEFRTSMSDIMFIKTERYLHGGVGYAPHMAESVLSAGDLSEEVDEHQGELGIPDDHDHDHDHHHDHDHDFCDHDTHDSCAGGTATMIPPPEKDFRGFVGVLHREVKPWRDPSKAHIHTDGRELLPWFRAMTLSDPGYIRGYVAGSFWLQSQSLEVSLAFVDEGLTHNPDAFELYVSRGFLLLRQIRREFGIIPEDPSEEIRPLMREALDMFRRGADLALRQRPDDVNDEGVGSGGWSRYQEDDARAAANMAVTLTRFLGDPDGARDLARRYLAVYPDFAPLQRALD